MIEENWSYLCGVTQEFEADIIIGLLNVENIPALKKYPDAGGFLKIAYGLTTGVDLYVPFSLREDALQLIKESLSNPINNISEHEEEFSLKEKEVLNDITDSTSSQNTQALLWSVLCAMCFLVFYLLHSHRLW